MVLIVYELGQNEMAGLRIQRHYVDVKLEPGRYYTAVVGNAEIHVMADVAILSSLPPAKVFSIKDCDDEDLIGELEHRLYDRLYVCPED